MLLFPASATMPLRLYLDESGTLGFGGEVFTMAMVLVSDLASLETSIARNKTTQAEIKASQMKTPQKLELAKKLLEENDLQVFLLTIDPAAAYACERKLDKELLYDSMIAQAMAYYLQRGELPRGRAYRLSLDMRGGIRESFEDMVRESIGNVLMHRDEPLVTDLQVRYMDSKYSAGVQVADLFSNIYRTTLSAKDSPCNGFLAKHMSAGVVHAGFSFGLRELADQMSQIAADLRARVEYEERNHSESTFRTLPLSLEEQFPPKTTLDRVMIEGEKLLEEAGREGVGTAWAAQVEVDAGNASERAAGVSVQAAGAIGVHEGRGEADVLASGQGEGAAAQGAEGKVASSGAFAPSGAPVDATAVGAAGAPDAASMASVASGPTSAATLAADPVSVPAVEGQESQVEVPKTLSRSARRRRSRAARKAADAEAALAVRLAMAADGGEPEGGNDGAAGVVGATVQADAAGASVSRADVSGEVVAVGATTSTQMSAEDAAGVAAPSQEDAEREFAGSAESATDAHVAQSEQPVKTKRPGWRAKAQLEAKAEKTAARAKANATASQGNARAEGDATPVASEGKPADVKVSEQQGDREATGEVQAAPKSKRRRSSRSRSGKAQEQAPVETSEVPAAPEHAGEHAVAVARGSEVVVDVNHIHEGATSAQAAEAHGSEDAAVLGHASEVVPATELASEQVHGSEAAAAAASASASGGEQAVVEGASGHTARERRQMAAQKSGAKKRTRKAKAASVETESATPDAAQGESALAAVSGNGDAAVPARVEVASEKATPAAGSQGDTPEASEAPAPAARPAAKRTRSRKAKVAPAAHAAETSSAPSGAEAVAAAEAPTSAEVAVPTASAAIETPVPVAASAPVTTEHPASVLVTEAVAAETSATSAPAVSDEAGSHQDSPASQAKPKAKRTRSRKSAAKPKPEVPSAD